MAEIETGQGMKACLSPVKDRYVDTHAKRNLRRRHLVVQMRGLEWAGFLINLGTAILLLLLTWMLS